MCYSMRMTCSKESIKRKEGDRREREREKLIEGKRKKNLEKS